MTFARINLTALLLLMLIGGSPLYCQLKLGSSYIKGMDFEPDDTFLSSMYLASNLFYNPIETIRLGFEVTTGSRRNQDKQVGRSARLSLLASFDF
jgi:hypothetical protein